MKIVRGRISEHSAFIDDKEGKMDRRLFRTLESRDLLQGEERDVGYLPTTSVSCCSCQFEETDRHAVMNGLDHGGHARMLRAAAG